MGADEVVLSIDETNKLRISLGLKPLKLEAPKQPTAPTPQRPQQAVQPTQEQDRIRARIAEARGRRQAADGAPAPRVQLLGAADPEVDNVAAWVSRSRVAPAPAPEEDQQHEPQRRKRRAERDTDDNEGLDAAAVAGLRVRHDVSDLAEGETVVLTLADRGVLDEGADDDLLEEVLRSEEARRAKARKAAGKSAKPLWEEDGKVRNMLDKYDEEEEEAGMVVDETGRLETMQRRQDEVRRRLAEGAAVLDAVVGAPSTAGAKADYYTEAELAALAPQPKKKKKRKLRTTIVGQDDEVPANGMDGQPNGLDLDALEAAATADGKGGSDLGSRATRGARHAAAEAARASEAAGKAARFEAALARANWASEALRAAPEEAAEGVEKEEEDAEAELQESLARARRLAQQEVAGTSSTPASSVEEIARQLAARREEDEALLRAAAMDGMDEAPAEGDDATLFTETTEFVRNIAAAVEEQPAANVTGGEDGDGYMGIGQDEDGPPPAGMNNEPRSLDVDMEEVQDGAAEQGPSSAHRGGRNYRQGAGGWVSLEAEQEARERERVLQVERSRADQGSARASALEDEVAPINQRALGRGLGGALTLLHETGAFKDKVHWAGRNNDRKPVALAGLEDVYTGGSQGDRMSKSIEVALTQRDEFGRVMTPKERFRMLNYQFHGIYPSKNKIDKRMKQFAEEVAIKQAATSENPSAQLDKLRAVQQQMGTAHIPLTGAGAAEVKAAAAAMASSSNTGAASTGRLNKAALAGRQTPLVGDRKVEAMLGIRKGGSSGGGAKGKPPIHPGK